MVVFVCFYIRRISEQAVAMRKDIHQLVDNAIPVLINLKEISERLNHVVTDVEVYWEEIDHFVKVVKKQLSLFSSIKIFNTVEFPFNIVIKYYKALTEGTSAFLNTYKHK
jgi:hypothetical protein